MLDCGLDSDLCDLAVLIGILTGGWERDELSLIYCVFFGNLQMIQLRGRFILAANV